MITLLCVYLNTYEVFQWNFTNLGGVFLISLPNTLWIANLMLANNICDLEEDEKNNRSKRGCCNSHPHRLFFPQNPNDYGKYNDQFQYIHFVSSPFHLILLRSHFPYTSSMLFQS